MNIHLIRRTAFSGKSNTEERTEISRRIGIVFLILCVLVYMDSRAQTISLNKKHISAAKVIAAIQEQSGYNLLYASDVVAEGEKTDVFFEKATLADALDVVVSKQPYDYELIGKTIVLKNRMENKAKKDLSSKSEGEEQEATVNIGYQKISKKLNTGSYSEVSREDIEHNSSISMLDRLSQLPGVTVQGNSIKIRGTNSLESSTDPLILLDGLPFPVANINSLSMNMVQNITVLKDADGTSLYGSRGGNGVILIATRQGGKTRQNNDELGSINVNKDGSILLKKAHVTILMNAISLWYNLRVSFEGKSPSGNYSGRLTKDIPLGEMIYILQSAGIRLKQKGENIVISG